MTATSDLYFKIEDLCILTRAMSSEATPKSDALSRDAAFWDSQVEVYERLTGGCTRIIAAEISKSITPPITSTSYVLDNACGTGAFTEEVKARIPDAHIMAADIAPGMARRVRDLVNSRGWTNVETPVQDMRDLNQFDKDTFTHVVTNFALAPLKDQDELLKATREMYRVLQDDGVCVVTSWAGKHPILSVQTLLVIREYLDYQTSLLRFFDFFSGISRSSLNGTQFHDNRVH